MTVDEWLSCLGRENGAQEPDRYRALAPVLRREAPRLSLVRRTAASMALLLRGQFPTEVEFCDALRQHSPGARAKRLLADQPIDPPAPRDPPVAPRPRDPVAEDRLFWLRRIDALEAVPASAAVLDQAQRLWDVMTRPGAAERPDLVDRLSAVVGHLERVLGREGETAARPPLDVTAPPRSAPVLARERPARPPRRLLDVELLVLWRANARDGNRHAAARVAVLEAAIAKQEGESL